MDKYIEILDSLMEAKKAKSKNEPSNRDKKIFRDTWVALAVESKFNHSAEKFLYEGLTFCGAAPFYLYLRQTEDKEATLNALFNGKLCGKDNGITFRLLTHLLALMLNDNFPPKILSVVIRRLVAVSINKENKPLGKSAKIIRKYFLKELSPNANLCPLANIEAEPALIKEFVKIISSALTTLEQSNDSTNDNLAKNIDKVREWFVAYADTLKPSSKPDDNTSTVDATENNNVAEPEDKPSEPKPENKSQEPKPKDVMSCLAELVAQLNQTAAAVQSECNSQKELIKKLESDLATAKNELSNAAKEISGRQLFISELKAKLSAAENEISALKDETIRQKNLIADRDAEIAAITKMADVISRDKTKQADESLQRMAAKIKIEYRDFMEAQNIPMSCDLGENLRDQLRNVFDILAKGGMKINGD